MSFFNRTKTKTLYLSVLGCAALFAVLAFASLSTAQTPPKAQAGSKVVSNSGLKVTIDIFSGRPNPTFLITDQNSLDTIRRMIGEARNNSAATDGSVLPAKLGYRGVIVENTGNISNIAAKIELNGTNMKEAGANARFMSDDGSLEDFLIETAIRRNVIDAAIADHIDAVRFQ